MKAYLYARISPRPQANESAEHQLSACRNLCEQRGWTVAGEFYDHLASGRSVRDRPEFHAALGAACAAKGVLVAYSLSRVTRSVRDICDICDQVQKCGAAICASDMPQLDTSTPLGRLFVTQLTALNEYLRAQSARITSEAMRHHLANGRNMSSAAPYGFAIEGKRLVPHPEEQRVLASIRRLHEAGESTPQIARRLNEWRIPPRGNRWHPETIRRIVKYRLAV